MEAEATSSISGSNVVQMGLEDSEETLLKVIRQVETGAWMFSL